MWYWKPVVATARAVGESLCPYGVLPCFSVRSVFGCRVVARAHVPVMILRSGLVYKTEQMAYPPAVACSPPASHAAVWQCGLVVLSSLPVAGSAPGLALLWWLTVMAACPQAISVKRSDLAPMGLFETHLLTNGFLSHQFLRHVWEGSACIPAAACTCMRLNLVHQCCRCCWLELFFPSKALSN